MRRPLFILALSCLGVVSVCAVLLILWNYQAVGFLTLGGVIIIAAIVMLMTKPAPIVFNYGALLHIIPCHLLSGSDVQGGIDTDVSLNENGMSVAVNGNRPYVLFKCPYSKVEIINVADDMAVLVRVYINGMPVVYGFRANRKLKARVLADVLSAKCHNVDGVE